MAPSEPTDRDDKDLPLREDIRLLVRILGDTVREQRGGAAFDKVERIRQSSIRFRRDEDGAAKADLEHTLNSLPRSEALHIIRAFGFFSHLANIAEDQHHIRRTRAHAFTPSSPREGTMAHALERARSAGISPDRLRHFFSEAAVVPVARRPVPAKLGPPLWRRRIPMASHSALSWAQVACLDNPEKCSSPSEQVRTARRRSPGGVAGLRASRSAWC